MTIDKEKLRPWFEAWYLKETEAPIGPREGDGYTWLEDDLAWSAFCAAFDSLGEPVGRFLDLGRYEGPKYADWMQVAKGYEGDRDVVPLYRLPEVK